MIYLANTYSAQAQRQDAIRLCREAVAMGDLLDPAAPYRLLWQVERSRIALVHVLAAAVPVAPLKDRVSLRSAAAAELRVVGRFIERTPDRNLSPSDRSLREDYSSAKADLEALPRP